MHISRISLLPIFLSLNIHAQIPPVWQDLCDISTAYRKAAQYANNKLLVVSVQPPESATNEFQKNILRNEAQWLPANAPFHLPVFGGTADVEQTVSTLGSIHQALPSNVVETLCAHKLLAPITQWLIRHNMPGVTNEATYLSSKAHPAIFKPDSLNARRLILAASNLTLTTLPPSVIIEPIYQDDPLIPIHRAQPGTDYADILPEETFATPYAISVVLRAPEVIRTFHIQATALPRDAPNVEFAWKPIGPIPYVLNFHYSRKGKYFDPKKGDTLLWIDSRQVRPRLDIAVFARCGNGPYGPPAIISFYRLPQERRTYTTDGKPGVADWIKSRDIIASCPPLAMLGAPRDWTDSFNIDGKGRIIGFSRKCHGDIFATDFSWRGEQILETHPNDTPKRTRRVRYFLDHTGSVPILNYEVVGSELFYPLKPFEPPSREE